MPEKTLFIRLTANRQVVQFNWDNLRPMQEVDLFMVTVKDAPSSLGTPDNAYYNLKITHEVSATNWIRMDSTTEAAIPLTGAFTFINFVVPIHIIEPASHPCTGRYIMEVSDTNGNGAIFSEMCLWFKIKF
jgi:hypothetical protein